MNISNYGVVQQLMRLDYVHCHGNESDIGECSLADWGENNCEHNEDVAVSCLNLSTGDERYLMAVTVGYSIHTVTVDGQTSVVSRSNLQLLPRDRQLNRHKIIIIVYSMVTGHNSPRSESPVQ